MATITTVICILLPFVKAEVDIGGMLYPRASETREVVSLDGLWNFLTSPENDPLIGFRKYWYNDSLKNVSVNVKRIYIKFLITSFSY